MEHEIARLRNKTDASKCHGRINTIANILRELQDEKFIQTMQVRAKPEQTVERLINRIETPLALRDKQQGTIQSLRSKIKELEGEAKDAT